LGPEIRRGSGLRSGDETTVVHAVHRRRIATDLAGRGCLVYRWGANGRRGNSLASLSQVNALGPARGGSTEHDEQNAHSDVLLHGIDSPICLGRALFYTNGGAASALYHRPKAKIALRQKARIIEKSW
jgi:hypothetical protein